MMSLQAWMADKSFTLSDVARVCKVKPETVTRWLTQGALPPPEIRQRLRKWTGGHVDYPIPELAPAKYLAQFTLAPAVTPPPPAQSPAS